MASKPLVQPGLAQRHPFTVNFEKPLSPSSSIQGDSPPYSFPQQYPLIPQWPPIRGSSLSTLSSPLPHASKDDGTYLANSLTEDPSNSRGSLDLETGSGSSSAVESSPL